MEQSIEAVGRALWLTDRRRGIGGTDAAAILGVSKFTTPYDVWVEKMGRAPEKEQTEQMWWGTALEDLVARRYTEVTGRHLWNPTQVMQHPLYPILIGTPDRLVIGNKRGVEIKTASHWSSDEWGQTGSEKVPAGYAVQCYHYMMVTGLPVWDIAVLIGGSDFRHYTLRRDLEFEAYMAEQLVAWWERHVEGDVAPEVTGASSTSDLFKRMFPSDELDLREANADDVTLMETRAKAKKGIAELEAVVDECENKLKARIENAEGLIAEKYTVTWKGGKPSPVVDWEAIARPLLDEMDPGVAAELVKKYTSEKKSPRRFGFKTHTKEA